MRTWGNLTIKHEPNIGENIMEEQIEQVVSPIGRPVNNELHLAPRMKLDSPKRFGFIWDYVFRGDQMFALLEEGISQKLPGSEFVRHEEFGNIHGHNEKEVVDALPAKLHQFKVDGVIVGIGA